MPYSMGKKKTYGTGAKKKTPTKVSKNTSGMSLAQKRQRDRQIEENKKLMRSR